MSYNVAERTLFIAKNGGIRKELLAKRRYLLFKSAEKWTESQKRRTTILFREYPDIKRALILKGIHK